eukprot:CAMPEP_0176075212 /NCGR_PEP_ID=MMETSP0120_2-20121206/37591_1 /TAXON_ID=160619 /ORGANISM="Kryptoperidinium foliaceum, Strain CCMP 1326" /LENGTH=49 /DNA_ID= /DNA_START= /DNA_END= /DNA_ORIENTATION=
MGSCCSSPDINDPVAIKGKAVIVTRGANLKKGDNFGSDPYVVVRVGEAG